MTDDAGCVRVLLVEDRQDHAAVIRTQLKGVEETVYQVEHVQTVGDAWRCLGSGDFDACLVDYRLNEERGTDLIERAVAAKMPVAFVLLTAYGDCEADRAAMNAGAFDFLEKEAITPQRLDHSIRYAIQRRHVEQSLSEARRIEEASKMYLQNVLDSLSGCIAVLDSRGRIERSNVAWKEETDEQLPFGARFQEGHPFLSESSESLGQLGQCVQRVRSEESDCASEVLHFDCGDATRWFLVTATRFRGPFDQQVVLACEDITIAHSNERKARLLEKAIEFMQEGVVITDQRQQDHPIVYANSGFEQITGYSRDEVVGRNCRFLQGRDTDPATVALLRKAVEAGEGCRFELINYRKDGTPFWNELRLTPIYSEDGTLEQYIGIQSDVTARKHREHELRESRERFDRAVRGSAEGLWEWDAATEKMWYSPLCLEMLGYVEGELLPQFEVFQSLLHKDDYEPTMEALRRYLATREPYNVQYRLRTQSGEYRWFRARGVADFDQNGDPLRMSGSIQDITGAKATEAALRDKEAQLRHKQRMEAVGSLAGGIAHEFNNLLHVIRGYTRFALEQYEEDGTIDIQDLREAADASNRAAKLTRQLLDFSRSEEPDLSLEDANRIVGDLQSLIRPLLGEQIEFRTQLCESSLGIRVDRTLMTQALMNICVNARDAMLHGGSLVISTERLRLDQELAERHGRTAADRYVRISVTDTGSGIPPELLERIFDPFFTTKEVGKGTGMGLSFVYSVLEQHGGFVDVSSAPGLGSTFNLWFPLAESEKKEDCSSGLGAETTAGAEPARVILIAEDEAAVRKVATRILERAGYATVAVENGEEAVLQFRQNADRIALVILDVVMPKLSGRDALDEIRRIRPGVPAIFCTGYDPSSAQLESATHAGVPIVPKPFDKDDLIQAVEFAIVMQSDVRRKLMQDLRKAQPPSSVDERSPTSDSSKAFGVDTGLLLQRCMGKGYFAQEILNDFEKSLDARTEELTRVVREDSPQQVATVAHSLKGAAGIVGAIGIRRIAAELESAAQREELDSVHSLLEALIAEATEFNETLPAIRRKLAGKASS